MVSVREQLGSSHIAIIWVYFNKTVISLALLGYEINYCWSFEYQSVKPDHKKSK